VAGRALDGLAQALYSQNRFDEAADAYTKLYYASEERALRERAVRGGVASLREARPGAARERRLEIIGRAIKLAKLSGDDEWRSTALEDLGRLQAEEERVE
jgi:hypothetical protein